MSDICVNIHLFILCQLTYLLIQLCKSTMSFCLCVFVCHLLLMFSLFVFHLEGVSDEVFKEKENTGSVLPIVIIRTSPLKGKGGQRAHSATVGSSASDAGTTDE